MSDGVIVATGGLRLSASVLRGGFSCCTTLVLWRGLPGTAAAEEEDDDEVVGGQRREDREHLVT